MTEQRGFKNFLRLEVLMTQVSVTLQKLFRDRWESFTGASWVDSPSSGQEFISSLGSEVYKKEGQLQRRSLESGNVRNWDFSMLSDIFQKVDFGNGDGTDGCKNVTTERSYLQELGQFRNIIANHLTKSIGNEQFHSMWKELATILIFFGYSEDRLEELRAVDDIGGIEFEMMKYVDPKSVKEANVLKEKANEEFKNGDFDKALQFYTEAIALPYISDEVLASLYSDKADVYVNKIGKELLHTKESTAAFADALENARKAVELYPNWWEARFRLGSVYEALGDYEEAITSFEQVVVLNPLHDKVKVARDHCRDILAKQEMEDDFDPKNLPQNHEEQPEQNDESVSVDLVSHFEKLLHKNDAPVPDVWRGRARRFKLDEKKIHEMAGKKMYENVVNKDSAEGMFNLAMLTLKGLGVQKDVKKAIELLKKAAAEPAVKDGRPNVGVAEAEFQIGLLYMEGIGFDLNPDMALVWYERASEHGNGHAANNLGYMYINGLGVKRNCNRAVEYWKLAASRKVTLALESLYDFYLEEKNPEQAKMWFERAVEDGSTRAKQDLENFNDRLEALEEDERYLEVSEWERKNNLEAGDLSLPDRAARMFNDNDPTKTKERAFKQFVSFVTEANKLVLPISNSVRSRFDGKTLLAFAEKGSKTAISLLTAMAHFQRGFAIMQRGGPSCEAVHHIAVCLRTEHITAEWPMETIEKFLKLVEKQLRNTPKKEISLYDRELRICYAFLRMNSLRETLVFLDETIPKYPDETCLYELRSGLYAFLKQYEEGFQKTKEALMLFPNDSELLYARAGCLKSIHSANPYDIIRAYEDYLKVAEVDARKAPESYYNIAYQYMGLREGKRGHGPPLNSQEQVKNTKLVRKWYNLGLQAEKSTLPCFLPYDSQVKQLVESLLQVIEVFPDDDSLKMNSNTWVAKASAEMMPQEEVTRSCPIRLQIIEGHREALAELLKKKTPYCKDKKIIPTTLNSEPEQKALSNPSSLKTITLCEMDTTLDHAYNGSVLHLTSIEDAIPGYLSIALVVEDDNKDVHRVFVYNFPDDQDVQEKLGFGCKFSVINPYMRVSLDGKPAIQVDDPSSLFLQIGRDTKRCRCCGKGDSSQKCARCKRAFYCSKECQTQDWKLCKHKLVCMEKDKLNCLVVRRV